MSKPEHQLDPAIRSWLDNVFVPALLKEYLAEMQREKPCARAEPVKDSAPIPVSAEEGK